MSVPPGRGYRGSCFVFEMGERRRRSSFDDVVFCSMVMALSQRTRNARSFRTRKDLVEKCVAAAHSLGMESFWLPLVSISRPTVAAGPDPQTSNGCAAAGRLR